MRHRRNHGHNRDKFNIPEKPVNYGDEVALDKMLYYCIMSQEVCTFIIDDMRNIFPITNRIKDLGIKVEIHDNTLTLTPSELEPVSEMEEAVNSEDEIKCPFNSTEKIMLENLILAFAEKKHKEKEKIRNMRRHRDKMQST